MKGLEHLTNEWVSVLRWLAEGRVELVLVGSVAEAIRGSATAAGPVAIVPAPYRRNLDRLSSLLLGTHAQVRTEDLADTPPVRFNAAKLATGERWAVRCESTYDLDIEIAPAERYSELLYDARRFEIEQGLSVEVASPEDLAHHSHVPLAGEEPEIRVSRGPVPSSTA